MIRPFEGSIALPGSGLMVTIQALGLTFAGSLELGSFEISLPLHASPNDDDLISPDPSNERFDKALFEHEMWGYITVRSTTDELSRPLSAYVKAVAFRARIDDDSRSDISRLVVDVRQQFDRWYTTAASWIEVWTLQLIDMDQSPDPHTRGTVWDLSVGPPVKMGMGQYGSHLRFMREDVAATPDQLTSAFARATAGERPPAEWLALMTAKRSRNSRLAVIEAATAAEIAMAGAVERRLPTIAPEGITRIIQNANGAAGLVKLLDLLDGKAESPRGRVFALLAEPRNHAVHGGALPSAETVTKAIRTAQELLDEFSPPPPADLGYVR